VVKLRNIDCSSLTYFTPFHFSRQVQESKKRN
jgi:hypothetical protein